MRQMFLDDTIAAIATAPGPAAIAIVRASGPDVPTIAGRVFRRPGGSPLRRRVLEHGTIRDPRSGEPIDDALACYMPAPRTYTGEPVLELHCHGGDIVAARVLGALLDAGARHAEAGEFTLRAVRAGRLDLAQAEAILEVVQARTDAARRAALAGLGGGLSRRVEHLRAEAIEILAHLTATIDFPEDDVPTAVARPRIEALRAAIGGLLATAAAGSLLRNGARVALTGKPNVGKSSLLNALARRDRAIVAPTPGTTRDTIEETIDLGGVPLVAVDTAGLRRATDPVEQRGVARARDAAAAAEAVLFVVDGAAPIDGDDRAALAELARRPTLLVANKLDAAPGLDAGRLARQLGLTVPAVAVSAHTGAGLDALTAELLAALGGVPELSTSAILVTNARHAAALGEAAAAIDDVLALEAASGPPDLIAHQLDRAATALGAIVGRGVTDDLLATIFSRFCIGK